MHRMRRRKHFKFDSLMRFVRRYNHEIDTCAKAEAHLAGIVLVGAAVEYALISMMRAWPHIVYRHGRKLKEKWVLQSLNQFAKQCGWLDRQAYWASERIRRYRNLVHPAWFASRHPPRITKRLFNARVSDRDVVLDSLRRWVFGS